MIDYRKGGYHTEYEKPKETPIYKGCSNRSCYCSGDCKKVIGHTREDGTKVYYEQNNEFGLDEISN